MTAISHRNLTISQTTAPMMAPPPSTAISWPRPPSSVYQVPRITRRPSGPASPRPPSGERGAPRGCRARGSGGPGRSAPRPGAGAAGRRAVRGLNELASSWSPGDAPGAPTQGLPGKAARPADWSRPRHGLAARPGLQWLRSSRQISRASSLIRQYGEHIPCVGAIVRDGAGRLLLIKRGHDPEAGFWSLPGGRIEPGESDTEALVREMREETGLTVRPGPLIGAVQRPGPGGSIRHPRLRGHRDGRQPGRWGRRRRRALGGRRRRAPAAADGRPGRGAHILGRAVGPPAAGAARMRSQKSGATILAGLLPVPAISQGARGFIGGAYVPRAPDLRRCRTGSTTWAQLAAISPVQRPCGAGNARRARLGTWRAGIRPAGPGGAGRDMATGAARWWTRYWWTRQRQSADDHHEAHQADEARKRRGS